MRTTSVDFDELFARERWMVPRERHRQAIGARWIMVGISCGLAAGAAGHQHGDEFAADGAVPRVPPRLAPQPRPA